MRLQLQLVGYEREYWPRLWANILRWIGIWPFILPEEDFYCSIMMLTAQEYLEHPPTYSSQFDENGRWLLFNAGAGRPGDNRPGFCEQPLTDNPPWVFWHEFGEWLGSHILDYDTEHFDRKAHCDAAEPVAGACPQLACRGPEVSSHCVKCRAAIQKRTGLVVNIRQTPGEYRWIQGNFTRPPWWPYADLNAQMAEVSGYDYSKYPVDRILGNRLGWFLTQPIKEPAGRIHLILERILGGDGLPRVIVSGEHPEYIFDPVEVRLKAKGFLLVMPDPVVAGETAEVYAFALKEGVETPIPDVKVFWGSKEVGLTGPDGKIKITP